MLVDSSSASIVPLRICCVVSELSQNSGHSSVLLVHIFCGDELQLQNPFAVKEHSRYRRPITFALFPLCCSEEYAGRPSAGAMGMGMKSLIPWGMLLVLHLCIRSFTIHLNSFSRRYPEDVITPMFSRKNEQVFIKWYSNGLRAGGHT